MRPHRAGRVPVIARLLDGDDFGHHETTGSMAAKTTPTDDDERRIDRQREEEPGCIFDRRRGP